jgi:hypothetical protein
MADTEINQNDLILYRFLVNTGTSIDDIPEPYKTALGGTNEIS